MIISGSTYSKGRLRGAGNGAAVQQHLLEQNLARVFHAHGHHGKTISDQDDIHARVVGDNGAGKVVGREHGDGVTLLALRPQGVDGDLFSGIGRGGAHGGVGRAAHLAMAGRCRGESY